MADLDGVAGNAVAAAFPDVWHAAAGELRRRGRAVRRRRGRQGPGVAGSASDIERDVELVVGGVGGVGALGDLDIGGGVEVGRQRRQGRIEADADLRLVAGRRAADERPGDAAERDRRIRSRLAGEGNRAGRLTAAPVTGAPNSPVSHQPVPCTSSGMSTLPSSVIRLRYGSWALRPRPSSGSSPSGCSEDKSHDLKSSER